MACTRNTNTFIHHLSFSNGLCTINPSTTALHVSAINHKHKSCSIPDTTSTYSISKTLEGFKRIRSNPDTRIPIMYNTLISICKILNQICTSSYEVSLFKAAYTLAFFGLLRVSELVLTSPCNLSSLCM